MCLSLFVLNLFRPLPHIRTSIYIQYNAHSHPFSSPTQYSTHTHTHKEMPRVPMKKKQEENIPYSGLAPSTFTPRPGLRSRSRTANNDIPPPTHTADVKTDNKDNAPAPSTTAPTPPAAAASRSCGCCCFLWFLFDCYSVLFFIGAILVWSFSFWERISGRGNVTLASFRYFLPYLTILSSYYVELLRHPFLLIFNVLECLHLSYCFHRLLKNRLRAKNLADIFVYSTLFLSVLFSHLALVQDRGSAFRGQLLQIMETLEDHGWCSARSSLAHFPNATWVDFYSPAGRVKTTYLPSASSYCDLKGMTKMKNTLLHKLHPDKHHGSSIHV